MKEIRIKDLKPGLVPGLAVAMPGERPYGEMYFEWTAAPLTTTFRTRDISGGTLKAWKSVPRFSQIETHVDAEMFYFLEGTAIMPFADMKDGKPDQASLQIVRIAAGTRVIIPEGKAHFVPVAEGDVPVSIVVVAPKMDAPRVVLEEEVLGV
jgi:oxalate decarboxylase/phosphoglucose isomerase-like protein (cupin superfamily)